MDGRIGWVPKDFLHVITGTIKVTNPRQIKRIQDLQKQMKEQPPKKGKFYFIFLMCLSRGEVQSAVCL